MTSQEIDLEQKIKLYQREFVYRNYGQEMLNKSYNCYQSAINSILDEMHIDHSEIRNQELLQPQPVSIKSKFTIISSFLRVRVENISFDVCSDGSAIICKNIEHTLPESKQNNSQATFPILVVSEALGRIKIGDNIFNIKQTYFQARLNMFDKRQVYNSEVNRAHLKRTKTYKSNNYHFTSGTSFCQGCLKFLTLSSNKSNLFYLRCTYCNKNYEVKYIQRMQNGNDLITSQQVEIKSFFPKYSSQYNKSIVAKKKRNNLKVSIEEVFGIDSFSNFSFYSSEVPKMFTAQMNFHSLPTQKEINYNRQLQEYLPLQIRKSSIESAGLGMFATQKIAKDQMIITYSGVVRTHYSADPRNNSLFILGNLTSSLDNWPPLEVLLEPTIKLNAGRFINCGISENKNNASSILGLLINSKGQTEICIYIYANRNIHIGDEIFYDYGDLYGLTEKEEQKSKYQ